MRFLKFILTAFLFRSFLFVLILTIDAKAQQNTNPQLPLVLPPAPNAGELGKYGNIPINNSTGAVNYSIPLLGMTSGALKLDIGVSYNAAGIKVDQIASRAGLGWVLNAGGVISRTVNGDPDETSQTVAIPSNLSFNTPEVVSFLNNVVLNKDNFDTQPDLFNFNFNGYSGRFILNPDDKSKVVFLESSNLIVQTNFSGSLGNGWTIKVIDPNGISYYFGGSTATEKSRTQNSGQGCGKTYDLGVQNAWYLNKIEDLNGDFIILNYLPVEIRYYSSASETIVEQTVETRTKTWVNPSTGEVVYCPPGYQSKCVTNIINNGVILDKIISSKGSQIQFTYIDRKDIDGDKLISKMEYGLVGKPYSKTFAFEYQEVLSDLSYNVAYSFVNNNYRPYLTRLTEWSQGLTASKKHQFSYYNAGLLPPRLSYAQDHFGFFNGRYNTGFLPTPIEEGIFNYLPNNRDPSLYCINYGMLSKIIYPTSGADSIIYESHTFQEDLPGRNEPHKVFEILDVTGTGLKVSQSVARNFSISVKGLKLGLFCFYSGVGVADGIHQRAELTIRSLPSGSIVYYRHVFPEEMVLTTLPLEAGNYDVTLVANGQAAIGHAWIEGVNGYDHVEPSTSIKTTGGVRVKNVLTYDPVSDITNVKSYNYARYLQQTKSSGVLLRPETNYFSKLEMRAFDSKKLNVLFGSYNQASSSGDISVFSNDGNHLMYTDVTESDGLDLSNGATYYQYEVQMDVPSQIARGYMPSYKPYSISGMPSVLERYRLKYKTVSSQLIKFEERFQTYKSIFNLSFDAYQGVKNYDIDVWGGEAPFNIAVYQISSYWNYNDSTKTITYDAQGLNPAAVITENVYQNPVHLQLTETNTNSSIGKKITNKLLYPHEMVSSGQDPTGVYANMIAKNKIAPVVEEKKLNGGVVTDLKRTNYYEPYPNIFVAQSIETFNPILNGNETRIKFNKYNAKGNVLNVSLAGGTKISYLWSYNHQFPIAEIKGLDQGQIENTLSIAAIDEFSNLSAPDKFAVENFLAPLKAALPESHISKFVYEPLKGLVSQTDAKGMVTYYEYDSFLRLMTIKDQNQNIIKNYQYNYKQ